MPEWKTEVPTSVSAGQKLLGDEQGAVNGFSMGVTCNYDTEYGEPATHVDQEGFYVVSGEGFVKLGEDEYKVGPGMAFIAKAGEPHTMRKTSDEPLKVLWSHGAIE